MERDEQLLARGDTRQPMNVLPLQQIAQAVDAGIAHAMNCGWRDAFDQKILNARNGMARNADLAWDAIRRRKSSSGNGSAALSVRRPASICATR